MTAYSWPAFLYPDGQFDAENLSLGLFKGPMLVRVGPSLEHVKPSLTLPQAFKAIFISPTSTEALESGVQNSGPSRKCGRSERRTCPNIANLIGMKIVQPHAIAYAACQVCYRSTVHCNCGTLTLFNLILALVCPVIMWVMGTFRQRVRHAQVL